MSKKLCPHIRRAPRLDNPQLSRWIFATDGEYDGFAVVAKSWKGCPVCFVLRKDWTFNRNWKPRFNPFGLKVERKPNGQLSDYSKRELAHQNDLTRVESKSKNKP